MSGKKTDEAAEVPQEIDENAWPAWFYGPAGASQIFESPEDVPEGWEDHPSKIEAIDL